MLKDARRDCAERLHAGGIADAETEATLLLEHITGYGRASQLAHATDALSETQTAQLISIIEKRLQHIPLQYLLGSWSFCGLELSVGEGVLIPRDDTEVVLQLCLDFLQDLPQPKALDLCAGSGAIAIALAQFGKAHVDAVELSEKAFYFLEKNIKHHHAAVRPVRGDIFTCHGDFADGGYDLIVSNPPYIKSGDIAALQAEVQHEPRMALDGGSDGYTFYEAIIALWRRKLRIGGALAFELGEDQAETVAALMRTHGFENIRTAEDFGGVQRAIIGTVK